MKKVYLLIGGSSEIGMALLKRLLTNGSSDDHYIVQGYGDLENIQNIASKYPGQIDIFDVDLSDIIAMQSFAGKIEKQYSIITHYAHMPARNILYVNFGKIDKKRLHSDLQVQIDSAIQLCKIILPKMVQNRNGYVVFMPTSPTMGAPPNGTSSYNITKSSIYALAKCLAAEYIKFGITVNCVAPAMIKTKFVSQTPLEIIQMMTETNSISRLGTPDDVVPTHKFLFSEGARYLTSINLPVTGGFDM